MGLQVGKEGEKLRKVLSWHQWRRLVPFYLRSELSLSFLLQSDCLNHHSPLFKRLIFPVLWCPACTFAATVTAGKGHSISNFRANEEEEEERVDRNYLFSQKKETAFFAFISLLAIIRYRRKEGWERRENKGRLWVVWRKSRFPALALWEGIKDPTHCPFKVPHLLPSLKKPLCLLARLNFLIVQGVKRRKK